ncbi:NAD-dependent epimerase/dehydratase family protein [Candidatus Pelagibacter sp.]|nr:NAD-dependent epimerase/dehydratase family protein [Candidatus Pelagibacter sp.]
MINILVTGGSGFIGSNLVKFLISKKKKVTVIDNNFRGSLKNLRFTSNKLKFIKGDLRDEKVLKKSLKNIDTVFHLAAINGTENFYKFPGDVLDVGINGTSNLIKAVNKSNIKKFIFASSSEIYQKPIKIPTPENININFPNLDNPRYSYGISKLAGEMLVNFYLNKNIKKIIFRPHNIYGPAMGYEHVVPQFIKKIKVASNNLIKKKINLKIQGNGRETRSFCFIDDAIEQIFLCSEFGKDRNVYNIGKKKELSIINLIKKIENLMGIQINIQTQKIQEGSVKRRCPDVNKINKFKIKTDTSLKDGLKKTIDWYLKDYNR